MDKLEETLQNAERDLANSQTERRVRELRAAREQHSRWVRDYGVEVKQLEMDVANVAEIAAALPQRCYRRVVLEP
ncbi:LAMC3 [Cordylochernes scorpioides]|uniref:LAMC3 n=1 Tax=Cordylochernes scorpioides TaxID=51811 RepID=A0ABY6KEG8_9ARAC|nr:LAMC3 [Cordylochernes scorpioides]